VSASHKIRTGERSVFHSKNQFDVTSTLDPRYRRRKITLCIFASQNPQQEAPHQAQRSGLIKSLLLKILRVSYSLTIFCSGLFEALTITRLDSTVCVLGVNPVSCKNG